MNRDHDLLFGLLAFQKGAIEADRLAETIADPDLGPGKTIGLADRLVDRGFITVEQRAEIEATVAQELEAHGGDPEATIAATVDGRCLEALKKLPEIEEKLDYVLQKTIGLEQAAPVRLESLGNAQDGSIRERYTLTHLYAKGGMGQVWLAHDPKLDREIALKELRPDQLDSETVVTRFMTEAKVTAQLEHPGIVPVYELGNGDPRYYTMRFVKGGTLSQATRTYHKEKAGGKADRVGLVKLLTAFVSVCNAMAYAHSRGFIHRDLKGQNIVLGDFGEVIVLDWGLAKHVGEGAGPSLTDHEISVLGSEREPGGSDQTADLAATLPAPAETNPKAGRTGPSQPGQASGTGLDLTVQGQILGTPAYMAPEQAEGWQYLTDARTDVYSLGAILYEILTGHPPFQGRSTNEVLRKVRKEPPAPPSRLNPQTPPALQAVCLKALAKKPNDRYASAADLAREVERYLADEPVLAYPEPWTRHAARWARKHKATVAAAAGLLVTSTVALGISTVLISQERDQVKVYSQQGRQTINDMYVRVAENWLEDRLDPVQQEFLQKALDYFQKYTSQSSNDPVVRLEHGQMFQRMGDIQLKLGRHDEAQRAYERAIAMLSALANDHPGPAVTRALAVSQTNLANLYFRQDAHAKAEPLYTQAETLLNPLASAEKPFSEDLWLLARTRRSRAELLRRKGDLQGARTENLAALDLLDRAIAIDPKAPSIRADLAVTDDVLARLHRELGDAKATRERARKSYNLASSLVAEYPTIPRYREILFNACNTLGGVEYESGNWAETETYWRRERKEAERLAQDYPDRPDYRHHLAGASTNLGGILAELGTFAEAAPILDQAIAMNTKLMAELPNDDEIRFDLGKCHYNLGYLLLRQGAVEKAIASLQQAEQLNRVLVDRFPDVPRYRHLQASYVRKLGDALQAAGRSGADGAHAEALAMTETLAKEYPDNALYLLELAQCLNTAGATLAGTAPDKSEAAYLRALDTLNSEKVAAWSLERLREKAYVLSNLGDLRRGAGKPDAEKPVLESIGIVEELVKREPPARDDLQFLSQAQENLAEVYAANGRDAESLALFDQSIGREEELLKGSPESIDDHDLLGYFCDQKGLLLNKLMKPADARASFEKAAGYQRSAVKMTDGKVPDYREKLAGQLEHLAGVCVTLSDYEAARKAAAELADTGPDLAESHFAAAKVLARVATAARDDTRLDAPRRDKVIRNSIAAATTFLREAMDANAKTADLLKKDAAFKDFLNHPEFHDLLDGPIDVGQLTTPAPGR